AEAQRHQDDRDQRRRITRRNARRIMDELREQRLGLVAALLAVSFVVGAWQLRGTTFSIAFAVIPLSAW
ncbi:MAG: hypothetical protein EOS76_38630, partial [Mesorhizobium sp.]